MTKSGHYESPYGMSLGDLELTFTGQSEGKHEQMLMTDDMSRQCT